MNRIEEKFSKNKKLLSIYFTAGYPKLDDTVTIIQQLEKNGADMVEIGLPFSDPLADGPIIQASGTQALKNGMTTQLLFQQLKEIRKTVSIPLLLMGYFNPILQFGVTNFCKKCVEVGIDGVILPDLPLAEFQQYYAETFKEYDLLTIFLITPQTSPARIVEIDTVSKGFIYMVSTASVTGSSVGFGEAQTHYFKKVASLSLQNPLMVGFGINNAKTFRQATEYSNGAIIGSAFIKTLSENGLEGISPFLSAFTKV